MKVKVRKIRQYKLKNPRAPKSDKERETASVAATKLFLTRNPMHNPESVRKMGETRKRRYGNKQPGLIPGNRKGKSSWNKGKSPSEETRLKLIMKNKGKPNSEKQKVIASYNWSGNKNPSKKNGGSRHWLGKKRPNLYSIEGKRKQSERLKVNNPMKNPEIVKKRLETRRRNRLLHPEKIKPKTEAERKAASIAITKLNLINNPSQMKNPEVVKKALQTRRRNRLLKSYFPQIDSLLKDKQDSNSAGSTSNTRALFILKKSNEEDEKEVKK